MTDTAQLSLPLVDLALPEAEAASRLYSAFRDVGFAYITNHGIPEDMISEAFSWSRAFFSLPQGEKNKSPHPPVGAHHRGYSSVSREKISQMVFDAAGIARERLVPDQKESFDLGRENDDKMPNIWPPATITTTTNDDSNNNDDTTKIEPVQGIDAAAFRAFFVDFYAVCSAAAERLLAVVAVGLDLPPTFFTDRHRGREHQLRLLHYPPFEASLLAAGLAACVGPHSDYGTLTLLFQDGDAAGDAVVASGLEVEVGPHGSGRFRPVPHVPGAVVVNVADMLMRWTNDRLRSTIHQVRTPEENDDGGDGGGGGETAAGRVRMTRRRYSIPFFVGADTGTVVDCVSSCHGPDRPKRYEPLRADGYYAKRANATY